MDNLQKLCLRTKLQQENSLAIRFGERKILFECVTFFAENYVSIKGCNWRLMKESRPPFISFINERCVPITYMFPNYIVHLLEKRG